MSYQNTFNIFIIEILLIQLFQFINNFYALPFETIYIKDETINGTDYHSNLIQNELYVNLSMGTPQQEFKSVLKMDKYGFIIYENALDYSFSSSIENYDEEINIGWGFSYEYTPLKDHFYLPYFNSYEDFNNNKAKLNNISKTNKITFLRIEPKNGTFYYFNKMFNEYGIIGLKFNSNPYFNTPELVLNLKNIENINECSFSFKFENHLKNGFVDNNNKGYFIIGEDLTDDLNEKEEIQYSSCEIIGGELSWSLKFDNIYTKKGKLKNFIKFKSGVNTALIIVNYPYLIAPEEYFQYINKTFFNELIAKNICSYNQFLRHELFYYNLYSYSCDSKSKYFMGYLNNNFPDLVFEHKNLENNFTLTKNDLFAYNSFNDSDNKLHFLIMNYIDKAYNFNWYLGIPFLKKYRLSFNYDKKTIGYYKNDGKSIKRKDNEKKKNVFDSLIFKISLIIILIIIIFILGMIFQKNIKKTRKKKANELDDNYEYDTFAERDNDNKNEKNNEKLVKGIIN